VVPVALVRLADLRRRQGRWEEAGRLYAESGSHLLAVLGRAVLALDRGESGRAAELAEEYLGRMPAEDRTERVPGLDILVRARVAEGHFEQARDTLAELTSIAKKVGTEPLRATVAYAEGCLQAAEGNHKAACARFEESVSFFEQNHTPFEAARSRHELAQSLLALGRPEPASRSLRAAREAFEELGAARHAGAARMLMQEIQPRRKSGGFQSGRYRLTPRELEVLGLVAQGMSDKEAAVQLGLSEHTIHRHVTNILTKTGLPSRAAAVAQAARQGLL
jgi:ATP/maltotriose-dependent transcriptional regulator MalT